MLINQDWDIKPRGEACAACQGPFTDNQAYVSQLVFGADGYVRGDYCLACWTRVGAPAPSGPGRTEPMAEPPPAAPAPAEPRAATAPEGEKTEGTISVWHGVFHPPPPPPAEPLKKETAESLLRSLMKDNDPARKNVIFILAVMLERRRLLAEREVRTNADGTTLRVYEHRLTGDMFMVTDPHLDLNRLGQVQEEVMQMLGSPTGPVPGAAEDQSSPENVQPSISKVE